MEERVDGLILPEVDTSTCIDCHACEKICPIINPVSFNKSKKVYAAWSNNGDIRSQSASGGIASTIYLYIKDKSGYAVGAQMNQEWGVELIVSDLSKGTSLFRNSKYTFSKPYGIYKEIKALADKGNLLAIIALPCQIAAFKKIIGEKENVIYIDLVCHGITPNAYLKQHIHHVEQSLGHKASTMSFRAPEKGTANYYFTLYDTNGNIIYSKTINDDELYNQSFHQAISYRENCYNCRYARNERCSDITIGDYHGLGKLKHCDYSENEVSVIIINTPKGDRLINTLIANNLIHADERPLEEPFKGDSQLRKPSEKTRSRFDFEKYIVRYNGNFDKAMSKVNKLAAQRALIDRIKRLIKGAVKKSLRLLNTK